MAMGRREVLELDKQFVWHPYAPMDRHLREGAPLVIERARGAKIYDADGREYIDGNASWWTALLGHNHPRLIRALTEQAARMCHVAMAGIAHEPAAVLARDLVDCAPDGLVRVFFSDDGSTAVELALKMCMQYWYQNGRPARNKLVALRRAFHGETFGATAVGGVDVFRRPFDGSVMDCFYIDPAADPHVALAELEQLLERDSGTIAAIIVEPMVQGAGGMRLYSAEFLHGVREASLRHDVFLIADEVFTGYGRTGPMWACEHAGVTPDVMCVAKGFTAGILPMAATLVTQRLFDGFRGADERALFYGHTYCGHALGAAVAREVLAIYREDAILENAKAKARRLRAAVQELAGEPGVSEPRALGMVAAVNVGADRGYLERAGWSVCEEARRRGAYLRPLGDVVYLTPPLNIPDDDLDRLLEIFRDSVLAVSRRG
jgi:adenosylmethionine-8-amino-7-oxononanoate aminotransferase